MTSLVPIGPEEMAWELAVFLTQGLTIPLAQACPAAWLPA
jgi:hypothetical protein